MQGAWNKMIIKFEREIFDNCGLSGFYEMDQQQICKLNLPLYLQTYNEDSYLQY